MSARVLLALAVVVGVAGADTLLFAAQPVEGQENLCPDNNSKCPNTATCCRMESGNWGCCPFPKATCCSDKTHCCPEGYSCNAVKGQCVKALGLRNDTTPWAEKHPAAKSSRALESAGSPSNTLTCPDGTICYGTSACCRTYTNAFKCCAFPNDVCCADGLTCCPRCTICDHVNKRCITGFDTKEWTPVTESVSAVGQPGGTPAAEKYPALVASPNQAPSTTTPSADPTVVWCDSTHYCQDGNTCCLLPGNVWGCCPYPGANCCAGSYYCCPSGKQCTHPAGGCY